MKCKMPRTNRFCYAFAILALFVLQAKIAFGAETATPAKLSLTTRVSDTGDAKLTAEMVMSKIQYEMMKKKIGNAKYFARMIDNSFAWSEVRDIAGNFHDDANKISASLTNFAYSKPYREGRWIIDLSGENLKLNKIAGNVVTFKTLGKNAFGSSNMAISVVLPKGSTKVAYDENAKTLTYDFVPKSDDSKDGNVDFVLDVKPKLMSSLAKVYGDEQFDSFWIARSIFQNSGEKVIRNLKIRHRVAGLSGWSRWHRTKVVYPKQTVVAPFFPVLDVEKIASFTEARIAMVEVEFKFEMDGKTVSETDSSKTKILSRNEILWANRRTKAVLSWHELFGNSKMIAGAFCSSNDPVIQQVAGAVTRMGGGYPQSNDAGTMLFLRMMWKFMEINKVSYQSPVGLSLDGFPQQHVKYGRDVIRNRAGTCVDLAVLWASVAKAVGLKSYILFVPGHALPVIELPSGKFVAIESTYIMHRTFDQAVKRGLIQMKIAKGTLTKDAKGKPIRGAGLMILADIKKLHSRGVHCLDLPRVEDGYLLKLGYTLEVPKVKKEEKKKVVVKKTAPKTGRPKALIGVWFSIQAGRKIGIGIQANGKYICIVQTFDNDGNIIFQTETKGTWEADGVNFRVNTNRGKDFGTYKIQGNRLVITVDGKTTSFVKKQQ